MEKRKRKEMQTNNIFCSYKMIVFCSLSVWFCFLGIFCCSVGFCLRSVECFFSNVSIFVVHFICSNFGWHKLKRTLSSFLILKLSKNLNFVLFENPFIWCRTSTVDICLEEEYQNDSIEVHLILWKSLTIANWIIRTMTSNFVIRTVWNLMGIRCLCSLHHFSSNDGSPLIDTWMVILSYFILTGTCSLVRLEFESSHFSR